MSCPLPGDDDQRAGDIGDVSDLRQLRIFRSLAQTGSFTETAKLMSVTQSAVSHSLKALETTLGVSLLNRQGKRPTLTIDGRTFLVSVSEILREVARATQKLHHLRQGELTTLRIGCPDTIGEFVLPDALTAIHREFPEARLILKIGETGELFPHLQTGAIDIMLGIRESEKVDPGLQDAALFQDELRLVTASDHPWATQKEEAKDGRSFETERLLLFGENSTTNTVVRNWIAQNRIPSDQQVEVTSIGTLKKLVQCGFGIGLVPRWVINDYEIGQTLIDFPLPGVPVSRTWCLYMRHTHQFSPLEKRFLSLLQERTATLDEGASWDVSRSKCSFSIT